MPAMVDAILSPCRCSPFHIDRSPAASVAPEKVVQRDGKLTLAKDRSDADLKL